MARRKYKQGLRYASALEAIQDIMNGRTVWWLGKPRNAAGMQNQQLHTLAVATIYHADLTEPDEVPPLEMPF